MTRPLASLRRISAIATLFVALATGCDRVVNLTPFYDAQPRLDALPADGGFRLDARPDDGSVPDGIPPDDGTIAFDDGAPPLDGTIAPDDATPPAR